MRGEEEFRAYRERIDTREEPKGANGGREERDILALRLRRMLSPQRRFHDTTRPFVIYEQLSVRAEQS